MIKEYWVYTPRIPKFLSESGITFIGFIEKSDAIAFAKNEAKRTAKKIEIKLAECPEPESESDFDNWKRCLTKSFAIVSPRGEMSYAST